MDNTVIPLDGSENSKARLQNWTNAFAVAVEELKALGVPSVDEILAKYSIQRVETGLGLNVDWPEGDERSAKGLA